MSLGFLRRGGRKPPALPDHLMLPLADRDVRVAVKASVRAVRFTLRLAAGPGDPTLTVPATARLGEAIAFLERHRGWLAERLAKRPGTVAFTEGALVPLRGIEHRVVHRPGARGTVWAEPAEDGAEAPRLVVAGAAEHVARRLRDHLVKAARADLAPAVARHAARLGVTVAPKIRIKDTRSRWGSCTATGELSFSWRGVMAPPHVLDYLAAHEVAHLREMNHSIRFWRLVRETCPEMDAGRRWLKLHGARLHGYGTAP